MNCKGCREGKHDECENLKPGREGLPPTWCACQHRKTVHMPDGTVSPVGDKEGRLPG